MRTGTHTRTNGNEYVRGKLILQLRGNAKYVYYEYDRVYDPKRKYTIVKRSTIGKLSDEDPDKMRPNENFRKFFPEVEAPGERGDADRSSALKAGTYMVINQAVKGLGLGEKLEAAFGARNSGLILDLAAYSVITENNAAQCYPDYAYNHPLFTPNMRIYSDSTISDFLRNLSEDQRQSFLNL